MQPIGLSTIAIATLAFSSISLAANEKPATSSAEAVTTTAQSEAAPAGLLDRTMSKRDLTSRPETRDWAAVDTDGDHLVTPEEMETYLKANPAPR